MFLRYDKDEIPSGLKSKGQDREDYLRNDDECFDEDDKLDRDNCPRPPKCDDRSSKYGKEKLCINRAYIPGNVDKW